ncbi:MAG: tripartite tricarboxylate transporter TctB family protein [Synergistaceae bacterium]|nr:tripartite tricarboxylate transporter TctB family protein [Synergistaceae bacterium]MBQ7570191.1 tripartite tricarboxylate transporter TctB family protein [Synergistaceae bacterium]MBQ9896624.1 tripartite tricarboxylate transporter TctB family protein [Synergistaceae bacterium]MBR0221573.1 tripartite tricarboxylate transporter TctB family protein [Synergistaceae bacterium]
MGSNNNKQKNFKDLIAGLVVMIMAAFFYWTTLGTKSFMKMGRGRLAPDAVPKAVAALMFALGIIIILKWFIAFKRGTLPILESEDDSAECEGLSEAQIKARRLFQKITMPVTILFVFLYILFMPEIGFVISTIIFLTFQITLLSTDLSFNSWVKNLIIALIAAIAIYIIFGCAFGLAVPKVSSVDLYLNDLYRTFTSAGASAS